MAEFVFCRDLHTAVSSLARNIFEVLKIISSDGGVEWKKLWAHNCAVEGTGLKLELEICGRMEASEVREGWL